MDPHAKLTLNALYHAAPGVPAALSARHGGLSHDSTTLHQRVSPTTTRDSGLKSGFIKIPISEDDFRVPSINA